MIWTVVGLILIGELAIIPATAWDWASRGEIWRISPMIFGSTNKTVMNVAYMHCKVEDDCPVLQNKRETTSIRLILSTIA